MTEPAGGINDQQVDSTSARFFDRVTVPLLTVQIVTLLTAIAFRPILPIRIVCIGIVFACLFAITGRWKRTVKPESIEVGRRGYLTLVPVFVAVASASLIMPSRGILTTLGWILIPAVIAVSMLLIGWGLRFRVQKGLFCAKCRYPVDAQTQSGVCAECGAALNRVDATVKEYYERQPWLIAAGALTLVLGVGSMFTTMFSPSRLSAYRLIPDAMVVRMATSEPDNLGLWQNIESRALDPELREVLIDGLLGARSHRTRSTDQSERWLTMQVAAGVLTTEQLSCFLQTYATLELRIESSPGLAGTSERRLVLDGVTRGSWFPSVHVFAHVIDAEANGASITFAPRSLNLFDITPGIRRIKARRDGPIQLPTAHLSPGLASTNVTMRVLLVAAGFGDAQEAPRFATNGDLIPSASHIASEWMELQIKIQVD
ncbi:MAG: hypothetical protein KF768_08295 [Phycisphaeraceae bacterium]|nr:hypothetical protein [Phycisphaeraceae bacterium]